MVLSMQLPKWIQVYFGSLMTLQELGRFWGVKKLWKLKTMLATWVYQCWTTERLVRRLFLSEKTQNPD